MKRKTHTSRHTVRPKTAGYTKKDKRDRGQGGQLRTK